MAPYMTARAARVAVLTSMPPMPQHERHKRLRECIAAGINLAEEGL